MRKLSFALVVACLAASVEGQQPAELQWVQHDTNGHWYGIPFFPSTWTDAAKKPPEGAGIAYRQGGEVATVRSDAENQWLQMKFSGFNPAGYWIGLNDVAVESTFVWSSGEPVTYTNWIPGQPDNAGGAQDAAYMVPSSSWRWDDATPAEATRTPIIELDDVPRTGFTLPQAHSTGSQPAFHALGDVTADGRIDIVVPNFGSDSISILPGLGGAAFGSAINIPTPSGPQTVALADFDGDGDLDIAVTTWEGRRVRVLINNGTGTFPTNVEYAFPGRGHGLVATNIDADADVDLVVTTVDPQDRLLVFKNNGNGTFESPYIYATGSRPLFVSARDIDGDVDVDLVVSNFDSDDLGLYRNQGDGTFTTTALYARGNGPGRVAISDLDLDGIVDLAIPNRMDHAVRIWWGSTSGVFTFGPELPTGIEPIMCITADIDGDNRDDLVTSCFGWGGVAVRYVRGGGVLADPNDFIVGAGPVGVAAADLNGDQRTDLSLTANLASKVVNLIKLSRDCNNNGTDDPRDIQLGISDDCNGNGEPDECDLEDVTLNCDTDGMVDFCEIAADPSLDLDHDGVLDRCEVPGTAYCFGDGTGTVCPCGPFQYGPTGHGCLNSGKAGGFLEAFGNAQVSADSVLLIASEVLPAAIGLFFQGNNPQPPGELGSIFGDGLLCVNTSVKRLGIRTAAGGVMTYGYPTDAPISVVGMVPTMGATRRYQVWYRDAPPFCTAATYNLTNGVRIQWLP